MTKKFTQEELEAAYKQMCEERRAEYQQASKAAKWVEEQLGIKDSASVRGETSFNASYSPYKAAHVIILTTQTYGPYTTDFTDKLYRVQISVFDTWEDKICLSEKEILSDPILLSPQML